MRSIGSKGRRVSGEFHLRFAAVAPPSGPAGQTPPHMVGRNQPNGSSIDFDGWVNQRGPSSAM